MMLLHETLITKCSQSHSNIKVALVKRNMSGVDNYTLSF